MNPFDISTGSMQSHPAEPIPVPYIVGGAAEVAVDLTVNGRGHSINGRMPVAVRRNLRPLWIHALD